MYYKSTRLSTKLLNEKLLRSRCLEIKTRKNVMMYGTPVQTESLCEGVTSKPARQQSV